MPTTPYPACQPIRIQSDDPAYLAEVTKILAQINDLELGQKLFQELREADQQILIVPATGGNSCVGGGNAKFYRLAAAFRRGEGYSVRAELGRSLVAAIIDGWTLQKISFIIAGGFSPATARAALNVGRPHGIPLTDRIGDANWVANRIEQAHDTDMPGPLFVRVPGSHYMFSDLVLRFFRPWLRRGAGGQSTIKFNPYLMLACVGDAVKPRPPAIGLAHELCHAWRNATGQRLFDDRTSCGLDDDEVMTTGLPPYQYEKFSENLFRSVWQTRPWTGVSVPGGLELRLNYR